MNEQNRHLLLSAGIPAEKIDSPVGIYFPIGEANALYFSSYPSGGMRCIKKVWIEEKKGEYRTCEQTNNPRKSVLYWNAPKKSTYDLSLTSLEVVKVSEGVNHFRWVSEFGRSVVWNLESGGLYDLVKFDELLAQSAAMNHADCPEGYKKALEMLRASLVRHNARKQTI